MIDLGYRKATGPRQNRTEIRYGEEDGDHVEERREEPDGHLSCHSLRHVYLGSRYFLCQVGATIGGANGISTVEHAHQEHKAVRGISEACRPVLEDKGTGSMPIAILIGHYRTDDYGDDDPSQDKEEPNIVHAR